MTFVHQSVFLKLKIGYLFRKIARNRQIIVEFFFCVSTRTPKKEEQTLFGGSVRKGGSGHVVPKI